MEKGMKKDDMARSRLIRFVFGMAVMAALFSGVLIAIDQLGLMDYTASEPEKPPTIESFRAEPETIRAGESATLTWNVSRAWNVSIEGVGPVAQSGEFAVMPKETTDYALTASNQAGSAEARLTVQVLGEVPVVEEKAVASPEKEPEKVIVRGPVGTV